MLSILPQASAAPQAASGGGAAAPQKPSAPPAAQLPVDDVPAASSGNDDNRTAPRRLASSVPSITGLRIKPYGVDAVLINISETGLLAECNERLKPGSVVTAVLEGTFTPNTMEGRVARTTVSSMGKDGRLRYHVGIEFTKKCPLEPLAPAPTETAAPSIATSAVAAQGTQGVRNRW